MADTDPLSDTSTALRLLLDERAILRTLHQYGHAVDYGPDDDFVDCFMAEGVWDVRMRRSGGGFRCEGRDELAASIAGQTESRVPAVYVKHIVVDPRIEVDGDAATVESYFLRVEPRDEAPTQIVASGRYLDRMVRSPDGRWRFLERIAEIDDL